MQHLRIKIALFINYFVFAILLNSVGTVILQVQSSYLVSESAAASLEGYKDLSIALVSFLVTSYISRIGYKRAMLIALALVAIACFITPSLQTFAATKLLFATVGASFALVKMSVYGTIGLLTTNEKQHISLMSFIESFFMVGILSGYFLFSVYVDSTSPNGWLQVYYLLGALTAAAFLLLWFAPLDESSIKENIPNATNTNLKGILELSSRPIVLVFILCAFFYVLIEQSIMSWLPTFNNKVLHLPPSLAIQMSSILAASSAIGRFGAGVLIKKIKWIQLLSICLGLAALLVVVAIPMAQNTPDNVTGWGDAPLAAFLFPLIGLLLAPIYPTINSIILTALPTNKQGQMSGLIILFSALGGTTGSIITGNLFQHWGGETAFYFSLVPITILLIALVALQKLHKKATAG